MRGGKVIPYKRMVDEAIRLAEFPPRRVLICHCGLEPQMRTVEGRDLDYASLRQRHADAEVPRQRGVSSDFMDLAVLAGYDGSYRWGVVDQVSCMGG